MVYVSNHHNRVNQESDVAASNNPQASQHESFLINVGRSPPSQAARLPHKFPTNLLQCCTLYRIRRNCCNNVSLFPLSCGEINTNHSHTCRQRKSSHFGPNNVTLALLNFTTVVDYDRRCNLASHACKQVPSELKRKWKNRNNEQ